MKTSSVDQFRQFQWCGSCRRTMRAVFFESANRRSPCTGCTLRAVLDHEDDHLLDQKRTLLDTLFDLSLPPAPPSPGVGGWPRVRTAPLIQNEIMADGRWMTYLCGRPDQYTGLVPHFRDNLGPIRPLFAILQPTHISTFKASALVNLDFARLRTIKVLGWNPDSWEHPQSRQESPAHTSGQFSWEYFYWRNLFLVGESDEFIARMW